jgi:two-component system, cell cycle sensor histidine kinase and response regulator CckA
VREATGSYTTETKFAPSAPPISGTADRPRDIAVSALEDPPTGPPSPADPADPGRLADFLQAVIRTAAEGICAGTPLPAHPFARFSVWNDRMTELTGYTMAEANQIGWFDAVYPDPARRAVALERLDRLWAGQELGQEERTITRKDGTERVITISTRRLESEPGLAFVALISDVTDRRAAEVALRRSEARLAEAQRVSQLGSWEWDVQTGAVWWSAELYRRYGKDPATYRPTVEGYLALVHTDDRDRVWAAVTAVLEAGSAITSEHRFVRPDGVVGWSLLHAVVERDADEKPVRLWGTCQDVTERKRMADARRTLEDQLREARRLESIGVLAGGIAHEFNNLLTTILGHTEMAEAEVPRAGAARVHLEPIRQAGQRAAELCRQMLAYAGKGRLMVGPVDLSRVAHDVAAGFGPDAPLDLDLSANLPPVHGDAEQLRQMVGNLLTNAIEAVAGTNGRIRLATYWDRLDARAVARLRHTPSLPPEEYVALDVRDNGPGMVADTLARAFEPFFTTKFPGRGLGLPVVLGVVRGHGGGLDVDSELGRGTTIRVYLPIADS